VTAALDKDSEVFHRWLAGDELAFREFFRRTAPFVLAIARRGGLSSADAEDVAQRTFVAVHRSRDDFRRGSRVLPWLGTIARNLTRDHWRTAVRRKEDELDVERLQPDLATREYGLEGPEVLEAWLDEALERLPQIQRDVIRLHFFEHRSFAECAAALGCSEGAAKVRAHRGYKQLREWLAVRERA
jgi:RNA polymerase sigma-70 factor (ECF subfamily)